MKRYLITLICLTSLVQLQAQDTMSIDVVKPFIATLSDAMKIQSNPNPEVPVVERDSFTYQTPAILREDVPLAYTIKPLALGTSLLPKLKNNYVRLGYGNYSSPLAELYLNTGRNRNYQAGLFAKHLSSNPNDGRVAGSTTFSAYGKRFVTKGVVEGDVLYNSSTAGLYGFNYSDTRLILNAPAPPAQKNSFSLFVLRGAYGNVAKDTSKMSSKIAAEFYRFGTNFDLVETDFSLKGSFRKNIGGNPLDVQTHIETNTIASPGRDYGRVFVDLLPTYRLQMNRTYLELGFNATFFNDSNGTKLYFYPKAEAGYQLIPKALTGYAGFRGNMERHTVRSLATENPFIRNFAFFNTLNQFDLYFGLKGQISAQTSFLTELSYATVKNLMFYGADSGMWTSRTVYDNSSSGLLRIRAELNHEFGEQFRFGFVMKYMRYDLSIPAPYSRPTFTTGLNLLYSIGNKFNIRSEIYTMNARKVKEYPGNKEVTLKGFADVNLGFDYRYSKTIMVFLNINNLTNNAYQRCMNLPVYGINVLGGLGITF